MGGGGGGWIEMCVLTQRRPCHMVVDLDLEERRRQRGRRNHELARSPAQA
jgi:hypothetical protein